MKTQRGFTLYELVTVLRLVLAGALIGMVAWVIYHFVGKYIFGGMCVGLAVGVIVMSVSRVSR